MVTVKFAIAWFTEFGANNFSDKDIQKLSDDDFIKTIEDGIVCGFDKIII